jgi:hypothetical protein
MIARKGSVRVIVVGESVVLYTEGDEKRYYIAQSHLSDLLDCLLVIEGRKGPPSWVAAQINVEVDGDQVNPERYDARPPVKFDGLFQRCPRGGQCIHEKICPGSIR